MDVVCVGAVVAPSRCEGQLAPREELGMPKQGKALPARKQRESVDSSLLIRSAESLGRVIGSLQRQLDGASKRLSDTMAASPEMGPSSDGTPAGRKAAATRKTAVRKRAAAGG